ncbi:hypothetical protein HL658_12030 [Azospirillum sp. RWY-5-1]|uniref:Uncharacterized protein n=1 Tax=Azospirillum oleiclasticum TaxID=2735135 RepID=A0ABX2T840_9PROT|nr:hypothetical protein [Azospirillum oleiclasticum]NYZ13282.1 hypothetical protein [Azospirillum oleiclasticum]NYZ20443.1 hypothetical protein [Azospirillum oleiclasticum]
MTRSTYTMDAAAFERRVDEAKAFALASTGRLTPAAAARVLLRTATLVERVAAGYDEPVADCDRAPHMLCVAATACGLLGPGEPMTPFAVGLRVAAAEARRQGGG